MENKQYSTSKRYHIYINDNRVNIVSNDFKTFSAEIEIESIEEMLFFKQLFGKRNSLDELLIYAKSLNLNIDIYNSLIEELINRQILLSTNSQLKPTKIINRSDFYIYLPSAPETIHEAWMNLFNKLKMKYQNVVFSPVFHSVVEQSELVKSNNWTKIIDFNGYKLARFDKTCFSCYKNRLFSNNDLLAKFYKSSNVVSVGYSEDLPSFITIKSSKDIDRDYDFDLNSGIYTKIWPVINCEREYLHVNSE